MGRCGGVRLQSGLLLCHGQTKRKRGSVAQATVDSGPTPTLGPLANTIAVRGEAGEEANIVSSAYWGVAAVPSTLANRPV